MKFCFFKRSTFYLSIFLTIAGNFVSAGSIFATSSIYEASTKTYNKKVFHYVEPNVTPKYNPTLPPSNFHPLIRNVGEVFRVEVGDTIRLPCKVSNLGPMVLLWKKGSRVLTAGNMKVRRDKRFSLRDVTDLQISNMALSDAGQYVCEVETDEEYPTTIVHTVEILIPPSLASEPSNGQIVVKKGSSVSLRCHTRGHPRPIITWQKRNSPLPSASNIVTDDDNLNGIIGGSSSLSSSLSLSQITRHHAGTYICSASNGVGNEVSQEIHLQVLYEPDVRAEVDIVHGGIGHQVELVCLVYSEPAANILWYKDTMLLDSNGKRYMQQKGNRHTLLIHTMEYSDFGNYSCSASNILGKARAYLTVRGNPRIPVFNSHVISRSRTSYRLSWITESFSPIDEYRLLYRMLPDDPVDDVLFAYNNVLIGGGGTNGAEHHQSYILNNLKPNTMYETQIQAKNRFGWSEISERFQFYTRAKDSPHIETSITSSNDRQSAASAHSYGNINACSSMHNMLNAKILFTFLLTLTFLITLYDQL